MGRKSKPEDFQIGRKYGRPDLERNGLFSEADYITTNEKYLVSKVGIIEYKGQGKQFQTSPPKKGHAKDAYFEKEFARIFEKEATSDLTMLRRKWRTMEKAKNISTNPFKPSSVPPQPSGKGSLYGTIEQQWPIMSAEIDISKFPLKPPPPPKDTRPNFLTKPPKKGGYGFANVIIGQPFEYKADPYSRKHEQELKELADSKKKIVGGKPFIPSSTQIEYFNPFAPLQVTSSNKKQSKQTSKQPQKSKTIFPTPFRPPSMLVGECINKYPSYEAPPEIKSKNEVLQMLLEDEMKKRYSVPVFRPSGTPKSYPIKSIIECNVPLRMPAWIQRGLVQV